MWDAKALEWRCRKQHKAYGRLSFIPPNAGEKYYARLILSVVKDLRSFDDLRTFKGQVHPTIRDVCHARGLLDNDLDLECCLDEAIHLCMGPSL